MKKRQKETAEFKIIPCPKCKILPFPQKDCPACKGEGRLRLRKIEKNQEYFKVEDRIAAN